MNKLMGRQKFTQTAIAAAAGMLAMASGLARAQAQQQEPGEVQTVVVTGVRAALEQSLRQKRSADSVVEVVTAEDIGKMPDKNVADAIQRLPGVNTQSSAGGEGGFGENDRVSLRGTSPSLQQTLFNGHAISTGDWFILNQVGGSVGRSSSFSLLPSELVGSIVVQKSPTADLVEGGVSGAINVLTRHPLDLRQSLTVEGSVQVNYNDLSKKTEPQLSALVAWKNQDKGIGAPRRPGDPRLLGHQPHQRRRRCQPLAGRRGGADLHRRHPVRTDQEAQRRRVRPRGAPVARPGVRPERLLLQARSAAPEHQLAGRARQLDQQCQPAASQCRGAQQHAGGGIVPGQFGRGR
jgi:hypothetical protein